MNIKKIISTGLAIVMTLQTVVFADGNYLNNVDGYYGSTPDNANNIENSDASFQETAADNNVLSEHTTQEIPEETFDSIVAKLQGIESTTITLDEIKDCTFEQDVSVHFYRFTLSKQAVVEFEYTIVNRSPGEKIKIYYLDGSVVTGKKKLLSAGTHEFYVVRTDSDFSSTLDYKLEIFKEYAHDIKIKQYSGSGVDVTTGNYSETFDDIVTMVAGSEFKIQRRYNSNDNSETHFSKGWSLNYECKASYALITCEYTDDNNETQIHREYNESIIMVTIPDGSVLFFQGRYDRDSADSPLKYMYFPTNSCHSFREYQDYYVLTTTDGTMYYYEKIDSNYDTNGNDDDGGYLFNVIDLHGNTIEINWNKNKVNYIVDISGNRYDFIYSDVTSDITQKLQRINFNQGLCFSEYQYDDNGKLIGSIDSAGKEFSYTYDDNNYLSIIYNSKDELVSDITYQIFDGLNCVSQLVDSLGATHTYTYSLEDKVTTHTITGINSTTKTQTYEYDSDKCINSYTEEVGGETLKTTIEYYEQVYPCILSVNPNDPTDYHFSVYTWNNGQIKKIIDPNGITTEYAFLEEGDFISKRLYNGFPISKSVLDIDGNVLEYEEYEYTYGTLLSQKKVYKAVDGDYTVTKNVYDFYDLENVDGKRGSLVRVEEYPSKYAYENQKPQLITQYTYATNSTIKGQPIAVSYSNSSGSDTDVWTYTYNEKGNLTDVFHPDNAAGSAKESYTYNDFGLVTRHESVGGTETLYEYNKGLQETKKTVVVNSNDRTKDEVTRTVYDEYGHPIQIIPPNEYNAAAEGEDGQYTDSGAGTKNEYYHNGLLKKTTDSEGNTTEYTYDCFGNQKEKIMHNGSIYIYDYDELSNLVSISFKESQNSDAVTLETNEYSYGGGYTTCKNTKPDDSGVVFSMEHKYDHNNNLRTSTILFEEYGESAKECAREIRYDLAGNIICDFANKNHVEWNAVYYTYGNYDTQTDTVYNEKFTLLDKMEFFPASNERPNGTYKYERTNYDKNGNISGLIVGKMTNGEFVGDNIVVETREYYADNLLKLSEDANGVKTCYEYDSDRNLSKVTVIEDGKKPQIVEYENAHNGKPAIIRTHVYDNSGNVSYITVESSYDKNGNLIEQVSSTGLTTEYTYNKNNLQISVTSFESDDESTSQTETTAYDFAGNIIEQTDKKGYTTKFVYNEQGFLIYTVYPNGKIKLTTRDLKGRVVNEVEAIDYKGVATSTNVSVETYKADIAKIPTMTRTEYTYQPYEPHDVMIKATKYAYDPETKATTLVFEQTNIFDYIGNHTDVIDAYDNRTAYEYDPFGNCTKYIEPSRYIPLDSGQYEDEGRPYTTFYEYDMLGRKVKEVNSDGDYYAYTYDKKGNILSSAIVEDGVSQTISTYTYDDGGRLLTQTDGNGHTTTLVYDDNNRLMKQYAHGGEDDETKTDYYSYDVLGNLTKHITRNGDTIEYKYDVFNRLVETTSDDGVVTYTYDKNGNILTMEDSTGITEYEYDEMNRILTKNHTEPETETETETKKVSYVYDIHENVPYGYVAEKTIEPDGDTVEKWYDSDDKIVKVIDGSDITEYNYYADGRLKSTTKPDGSVSTNTYDDEGNLLTLVTLDAAGDVLDSFTYVYDDNAIGYKNQISKTEIVAGVNKGTTSYEYDIQGRLTKVTNPDGSTNVYTYDNAGNRLSKTSTSGETVVVTNYTYDEQNRLTRAVTGNSTTYYGYDNNGNQISEWTRIADNPVVNYGVELSELNKETDDLMTLYEYDTFDRLIKIEQGEDVIENAYTADGKKFSRTIDGYLTYYVYDGNVVIEEQAENNIETARNVYGRNIITRENALNKIVYGFNGHGDVVYQANTFGIVLVAYDYDEFGNIISEEDVVNSVSILLPAPVPPEDYDGELLPYQAIDNPYRYAGYEYIEEIGIYDLNARYYNPEIARFISADPYYNLGNRVIGLYEINVPTAWSIIQANNIYVYCGNSPIRYFDYSGELAFPGEIHNLVVNHVAETHGFQSEQTIDYPIGWGRADLINEDTGEVWDVKREKPKQIVEGFKQVEKYTNNTWRGHENVELKIGGPVESGEFVFTSGYDTYHVTYRYVGEGVIAYDYNKATDWEKIADVGTEIAKNIVIVGGVAIFVLSGGSVPVIA